MLMCLYDTNHDSNYDNKHVKNMFGQKKGDRLAAS